MKKILTTTALASALVLSASYGYAQTTVTGQLDLGLSLIHISEPTRPY